MMVSSFLKPLLLLCVLVLVHQEIEATLQNVGLSKKASQSTTAFEGVASRAVDGNLSPDYDHTSCTHTIAPETLKPWWKVDLGQYYMVEHIIAYNRHNICKGSHCCCSERLRDVHFDVSNDDLTYKRFGFHSGPIGENAKIIPDKSEMSTHNALSARWIKIYLDGKGILSLCEVQVMARFTMRTFAMGGEANGKENTISVGSNSVPVRVLAQYIQVCNRADKTFSMRVNDESTSSRYLECYCPI